VPAPDRSGALVPFLALAFAVKVVVVWQLGRHPLLQPDAGLDTTTYVQLARQVLGGDVALGPGLYYVSPLYIYFLALTLGLSDSFTFVRVAQAALGTASLACVFFAAREWFGVRAAWIAAILAVFTGVFTFHEILLHQSALDVFLTAAALMCLAVALRRERIRPGLGAGALFGVLGLNRPNALIAMLGVLVIMALARRGRIALFVAAGVVIGVAPVVIRNFVVSRQLALVSSQGGLNFYIGNNAEATGQYLAVPGVRANIEGQSDDTRRVAEAALGRSLTDSEVSSYFAKRGWSWMRGDPAAAATLFARKLALVFNAQHQWLDFSYPYYARDLNTVVRVLVVGPWLLVPLGVAGLLFAPPARRAQFVIWASFIPCYAVAVAIFFVAERYRLPMFVPLCVTSGAAIDAFVRAAAARRWRPLAVPTAVLVVAAVGANWPFHLEDGRFDERLRLSKVLMNSGDYSRAAAELEQALAIDPEHTVAEFTLGMALVSSGRSTEGIQHIQRAVDRRVPIDGARYALARAMQASGDVDGAARLLRTFTPEPTDSADSCFQVGLLALDVDAPDVAERYFRQAVRLRPKWAAAKQQLGIVLMNQGKCGDAVAELRGAVDLGAGDDATYQALAYCGRAAR
jgi:Flp pilus assembly protein TadD